MFSSRDELFETVWPDVTVTVLTVCRNAFGGDQACDWRPGRQNPSNRVESEAIVWTSRNCKLQLPPLSRRKPRLSVAGPLWWFFPSEGIPNDPDNEWFADGIVEDITTALSRFRSLFVIARNSAFMFKGQAVDIQDVLGVRLVYAYVLQGQRPFRWEPSASSTGQLIDAETGTHVWADRLTESEPASSNFRIR